MKIGLMGGTFDPIHIGHMIAAQCVCEEFGLDEVWFMPTYVSPHKEQAPGASPEQRWDMVCLAVEGHPQFRPCKIELEKGGISYSTETVSLLRRQYPEYHFYYIIGADMVEYLPKWHKIDELLEMVTFVGLRRPGFQIEGSGLPERMLSAVKIATMRQVEVSSTWIRQRRALGQTVRYLVPDKVNEYIEVNCLYET